MVNLILKLGELKERFDMEKAVCNHGFFMMAPNIWNPSTKSLHRPLTLSNSCSIHVSIFHHRNLSSLVIQLHDINHVSKVDEKLILQQVGRMLRLSVKDDQDVTNFQQLHEDAKEIGFGRIFRSPSLFEDIIKSILLCNSNWEKTLDMASRLCVLQSKLADGTVNPGLGRKKRKLVPITDEERRGNFPSAKEIASLDEKLLKEHCNLGYRAKQIIKIAKRAKSGSLNLEELESGEMETEQVMRKLKKEKGFGDFATATVLMCIGYYHLVPSDTETLRLLQEVNGTDEEISGKTLGKTAQQFYQGFSPFQCLAYWFDLIQNYEAKLGKLSELSQQDYGNASGSALAKKPKAG